MKIIDFIQSLFEHSPKLIKPEESLSSIGISQSHMCYSYCYSFYAYRDSSDCFLDAKCLFEDGDNYQEINIENIKIADEEFNRFVELDKKYDFFSHLKPKKEKKKKYLIRDETTTNFTVCYGKELFSLNTNNECFSEIHSYFIKLAKKYNTESG